MYPVTMSSRIVHACAQWPIDHVPNDHAPNDHELNGHALKNHVLKSDDPIIDKQLVLIRPSTLRNDTFPFDRIHDIRTPFS